MSPKGSSSLLRRGAHALLLVTSLALGACMSSAPTPATVPLVRSERTPAAEGSVATHQDGNGNTRVTVDVRHLAPPERVASGASVYVVWAQPIDGSDAAAQNLGALRVSSDRRGSLETVTPLHAFDLLVTAEPSVHVTAPSAFSALSARVLAPRR